MKKVFLGVFIVFVFSLFVNCSTTNPGEAEYTGPYIANTSTSVFHKDSCSYLPDPVNRVTYQTRQEAVNAGYTPCGHCKP
jgi:competence protein ComEC